MTDEKKRIPLQLLYQIDGLEVCCLGIEEEIKEFERELSDLLSLIDKKTSPSADFNLHQRLSQIHLLDEQKIRDIYDTVPNLPALSKLASHEPLVRLVKSVLRSHQIICHDRRILLINMPNEAWHTAGWHQDYFYNRGPKNSCTLYIPLQEVDETNGSLMFLKGFKSELLPHDDNDLQTKWLTIDPKIFPPDCDIVRPTIDRGEVLIFNSLIPHTPTINRSLAPRLVLNLRYFDCADPNFLASGWRFCERETAQSAMLRRKEGFI